MSKKIHGNVRLRKLAIIIFTALPLLFSGCRTNDLTLAWSTRADFYYNSDKRILPTLRENKIKAFHLSP
ncbi:hypothetical protein [Limibacterium fermenti]|uniref:hypothetical protein n=1 Tax=Limibacterium fermenti TaxID=3229863 RepID=UPI0026C0C700